MPQEYVWSDLRTTHLLLTVGYHPHESIKILMAGWPKVEIGNSHLHHPGVGFGPTLLMGLKGQFSSNILS